MSDIELSSNLASRDRLRSNSWLQAKALLSCRLCLQFQGSTRTVNPTGKPQQREASQPLFFSINLTPMSIKDLNYIQPQLVDLRTNLGKFQRAFHWHKAPDEATKLIEGVIELVNQELMRIHAEINNP